MSDEERRADSMNLACDPLRFISLCWPDMRLYDKQREVLLSVRDNVDTVVHAANKTGKTRIAAILAIWFFATRTPARVVITSSNETQLRSILWSELRQLIGQSAIPLPFEIRDLRIHKRRGSSLRETEPLDYILGHVPNSVESFQGHHLPGDKPRVLLIIDEASGVPDEIYEAADSWAERKLVIGNPLSTSGFFYRLVKTGDQPDPAGQADLLRRVFHVDGRDSPNVEMGFRWREAGRSEEPPTLIPGLLTYADYLRREQQWDEVRRITRLHGQFYEGDRALLFPAERLDAAMDPRRWEKLVRTKRQAQAMGVDVAAGGRYKTCWTIVDHQGIIEQIVADVPNAMDIGRRTIHLMEKYGLHASQVAIDAGGGGKQIADWLLDQRHRVLVVGFGESADAKQTYRNRRAELYGKLRELVSPGRENGVFMMRPDAHELRQELAVLPAQYDGEGRMLLPPKEHDRDSLQRGPSVRQLLGRSPDRADSFVLAVWALTRPRISYEYPGPLGVWPNPSMLNGAAQEPLTGFAAEIVAMQRQDHENYDWPENDYHDLWGH